MAVGTVSGVNLDEQWQLIATNTPSAASSSSFTSISGYKKFWLVYKNMSNSTNSEYYLRFNSDSTAGNYAGTTLWYSTYVEADNTLVRLTAINTTATNVGGSAVIDNSFKDVHRVDVDASLYASKGTAIWMPSSPSDITSISFGSTAGTFTGTIYLYGIAA
jgi:hypothetical protein